MAVVMAEQSYSSISETPKKRRKFASPWDVPPSDDKSSPEEGSRRRRKLTSSWDVPPPLLQNTQFQLQSSVSAPENYQTNVSNERQLLSRELSPPWRADDREGHYVFVIGENLTPRYQILSKMGKGTFGQVLECLDRSSNELVAIKVVRGLEKYKYAAMIEINMIQKISTHERSQTFCVQMRDWFDYRNHICIVSTVQRTFLQPIKLDKNINCFPNWYGCWRLFTISSISGCHIVQVFEKLGPSLYDCMKKNNYCPFPIDIVRDVGRQLLESVAYMHESNLVHTDLKPENILFVSSELQKVQQGKVTNGFQSCLHLPESSAIKLIDFGSTELEVKHKISEVSTRHYRAPEVVLGLEWNRACDIWSVGCIIVDLCTGYTLFQTHENLEHLAMMERVLGPLPYHLIKKSEKRRYFRYGTRLDWPEGASSRDSINAVRRLPKLRDLIQEHVEESFTELIDLLFGLLTFDPSKRLTASEALKHPFFTNCKSKRVMT